MGYIMYNGYSNFKYVPYLVYYIHAILKHCIPNVCM